ncbi:MAG: hypothetical protein PHS41_08630, partial [Victivallaceae bacterium]|nr:hypothetical protein [Victivallaceae bacterium]
NFLVFAGYDVGRKKDLSAYFELELRGDVLFQSFYEVLNKVSFPAQIDFLKTRLRNPRLARLCMDYTGMGGPVCEELQRCFGIYRVEGVTFNPKVKEALAMPLRASFEDRTIRIASLPEIREDLHKVRKSVTAAGNVRFEGERDSDGHSDRFWALALARHARGRTATSTGIAPLEETRIFSREEKNFYRSDHSGDDTFERDALCF